MNKAVSGDEKFIKCTIKWGLLRRVAEPDRPWIFVDYARHLFDTLEQAYEKASELNTKEGKPAYLYKPVEVLLEIEVDAWIRKDN